MAITDAAGQTYRASFLGWQDRGSMPLRLRPYEVFRARLDNPSRVFSPGSGDLVVEQSAPTTPKRPVGIERKNRLQNLIRRAEVQDNIAAVPLQIDEIAGTRFNEPLMPVRSDSVRAAQFFLAPQSQCREASSA
ncbi:hypothetical protein [Bradyrhizobium sp. AUGA SZCCT0182]|uniref:hypothetical protein n=1 Tax=Bradyrhizobium sp. AUGA SZCCT0182 TaxID=2807667 RepID=UPI001BA542C2|nr:hypothetical protein [Bradyrhizobium sp. AUGA SZCCT0182]MBR1232680.1 hypothetical protein [Bradyrhizobium sp. AUGA SZCCT0182]